MTKWGKLTASSIALLALALTGCSAPASVPAPAPTVTVTATATPAEDSAATPAPASNPSVEITGDIGADVLAAGFDPDNMENAIVWATERFCEASHKEVFGDTEFDRNVRMSGSDDDGDMGAGAIRVIVHYKCPSLSRVLTLSMNDARENYWG